MAKLYFFYGAMGSSKTANALIARFSYEHKGLKALLVKSPLDTRDGKLMRSRVGLEHPCILIGDIDAVNVKKYHCVIVDEAQFLTKDEVMKLVHIVDNLKIPVMCYGLRADFKGDLFPGSKALFEMCDKIVEVKTICWCGRKALFNARFDKAGNVLKEGEQIVVGADDQYTGLCRKHWSAGDLGKAHKRRLLK